MNKYNDIKQIGSKELWELNLARNFTRSFNAIKAVLNGEEVSEFLLRHPEALSGKTFFEITEKDLKKANIKGMGVSGICKVIWLQKYLKGELSGAYNSQTQYSYRENSEINNLKIQIKELKETCKNLRSENGELKKEINYLKKEQSKINSAKNTIIELAKKLGE